MTAVDPGQVMLMRRCRRLAFAAAVCISRLVVPPGRAQEAPTKTAEQEEAERISDLVLANHILADQGIVDGFDTSDRIDARGDLPGVPGGRYYAFVHTSNDGSYAIECYFTKYDIAADIWMFTPGKPDPADLVALAQKQYALLP